MDALTIEGLQAYYGKAHVLQGVDLVVPEGSIAGLFGRNGAGKTTLLKAVMGLGPRVEGEIRLFGTPLTRLPADVRARNGMAYMAQDMRVFPELTVEENCRVVANAVARPRPLEEILTAIPELKALLRRPAGRLSGGEQQLAALARSLTMNCRTLLMDEPTEGIMPRLVERIGEIIVGLARSSVTVLLVEQNVRLGLSVCNSIHILEKGRVVASGSPDRVVQDGVLERYLGVRSAA